MGESLKPFRLSEPLVELPDRRVAVIGTDHGAKGIYFPGQMQVERELEKYFGEKGPNAILLDSLPHLDNYDDVVSFAVLYPELITQDFHTWGMKYAADHRSYLIAADPANIISGYFDIVRDENNVPSNLDVAPGVSVEDEDIPDMYRRTKIAVGVSSALIGAAVAYGLTFNSQPSRRQFLSMLGGAALGVSMNAILNPIRLFLPDEDAVRKTIRDSINLQLKLMELEAKEKALQALRNNVDDLQHTLDISSEVRELTDVDYQEPYFQRLAEDHGQNDKYAYAFRNAIIAETLAQPLHTVVPGVEDSADMTAIMGIGHLVLPDENQIGWLVVHKQQREEIIYTLAQGLFRGVEEGVFGEIDSQRFKEQFIGMGRSYSIDSAGAMQIYKFPIPSIERALN